MNPIRRLSTDILGKLRDAIAVTYTRRFSKYNVWISSLDEMLNYSGRLRDVIRKVEVSSCLNVYYTISARFALGPSCLSVSL